MTPEYRIEADGRDISRLINTRFVSLSVTDEVADQADKLSLNLADPENSLSVPPTGGTLRLWLGYQGRDLHYRGSFVVDETSISGPGTNIAITARAADMRGSIKAPRDQTWHESSLAEIAKTIATRHNLKLVLGPGLEQITYPIRTRPVKVTSTLFIDWGRSTALPSRLRTSSFALPAGLRRSP